MKKKDKERIQKEAEVWADSTEGQENYDGGQLGLEQSYIAGATAEHNRMKKKPHNDYKKIMECYYVDEVKSLRYDLFHAAAQLEIEVKANEVLRREHHQIKQEKDRLIKALDAMQSNRNDRDKDVKELTSGLIDLYLAVKTHELDGRIPEAIKNTVVLIQKHK